MFKYLALLSLSFIFPATMLVAEIEEAVMPPLVPIQLALKEESIAQRHALEELKLCQKDIKRHTQNVNRKIAAPGRPAPYGTVTYEQHLAAAEQLANALARQDDILHEMGRRERTILQLKELNIAYKEKLKRGEPVDPDAVDLDIHKARTSTIGKYGPTNITR